MAKWYKYPKYRVVISGREGYKKDGIIWPFLIERKDSIFGFWDETNLLTKTKRAALDLIEELDG